MQQSHPNYRLQGSNLFVQPCDSCRCELHVQPYTSSSAAQSRCRTCLLVHESQPTIPLLDTHLALLFLLLLWYQAQHQVLCSNSKLAHACHAAAGDAANESASSCEHPLKPALTSNCARGCLPMLLLCCQLLLLVSRRLLLHHCNAAAAAAAGGNRYLLG